MLDLLILLEVEWKGRQSSFCFPRDRYVLRYLNLVKKLYIEESAQELGLTLHKLHSKKEELQHFSEHRQKNKMNF